MHFSATRLVRTLPIVIAAMTFSMDASARCGCSVTLENGLSNVKITVSSIKTALKGSIIYKTQWTGDRDIPAGKSSKFVFDVDSACGKQHAFRFIRQHGKQCTRVLSCGAKWTCDEGDWK